MLDSRKGWFGVVQPLHATIFRTRPDPKSWFEAARPRAMGASNNVYNRHELQTTKGKYHVLCSFCGTQGSSMSAAKAVEQDVCSQHRISINLKSQTCF